MATIFQCGFIRTCIIELNSKINSLKIHDKHKHFIEQFRPCNLKLEVSHFNRKSKEFSIYLRKKGWHGENRKKYCQNFSRKIWNMLSLIEKQKHTLHNCLECTTKFAEEQSLFLRKETVFLKDITNTTSAISQSTSSSPDQ